MARWLVVTLLTLLPCLAWESVSSADQLPRLIEALDDANVRQGASLALVKRGEAAVPALRKSLISSKPDVRVWSAYTLGEIGTAAEPAVGDLSRSLTNSDQALRAAAAQALGKIGAATAVDALATALGDEHLRVRQQAMVSLGRIGPPSHRATTKLIAALSDGRLRSLARDALIQIGPSSVDLLVGALDDDSVRFDVLIVLRTIDSPKAKQAGSAKLTAADLSSLRGALYDATRQTQECSIAAMSLAELGEEGFAVLIEAFEQPKIARIASSAFSKAGPAAVPSLVDILAHERPEVRKAAAEALGQIGPGAGDAADGLIRLLSDKDRDVRYHAVRALHELGQKAKPAVPALREVILNSRELESARQWAIKTLVMTLPETHDAVVKALIEASGEEKNYGVRQLARQQLRKIDPEAAKSAGIK